MRPGVGDTLQRLAGELLASVAPRVGDDYAQKTLLLSSMLLQWAAEEWDRAAAWRVEENAALRRLFADAAPAVDDAGLRARLEAAGGGGDPGLSIRELDAANDALRELLIALHAHVEESTAIASERLERAIWSELRRGTERRRLSLAPF